MNVRDLPGHVSKETLTVMSSLSSCDPGNIFNTFEQLKVQSIRCSVVGLSAELFACRKLAELTSGECLGDREEAQVATKFVSTRRISNRCSLLTHSRPWRVVPPRCRPFVWASLHTPSSPPLPSVSGFHPFPSFPPSVTSLLPLADSPLVGAEAMKPGATSASSAEPESVPSRQSVEFVV